MPDLNCKSAATAGVRRAIRHSHPVRPARLRGRRHEPFPGKHYAAAGLHVGHAVRKNSLIGAKRVTHERGFGTSAAGRVFACDRPSARTRIHVQNRALKRA